MVENIAHQKTERIQKFHETSNKITSNQYKQLHIKKSEAGYENVQYPAAFAKRKKKRFNKAHFQLQNFLVEMKDYLIN